MRVLYTIGYEGRELEGFIEVLRAAGVTHVADVRERPCSRKRGFSKSPLTLALEEAGIGYSHWRPLGTPPEIRNRYKADHDVARVRTEYRALLDGQAATLKELAELACAQAVALLCFEADAAECHRLVTAERLRDFHRFEVRHL